jgi:hypothetical protein
MNTLVDRRRRLPARVLIQALLTVVLGTSRPAAALAQANPRDLASASVEVLRR